MAAAIIPVIASVAGQFASVLFTPSADTADVATPVAAETPVAPAVVDANADARAETATTLSDQQDRLSKLNQYNASLTKKGQLTTTSSSSSRTLLGD